MREKLIKEFEVKRDALHEEIIKEMSDTELYRWTRVISDRNKLKLEADKLPEDANESKRYAEGYKAINRTISLILGVN